MYGEQGFSLVELLVGMLITAALLGVIVTAVMQFTRVGHDGSFKLVQFDKLQSASSWFVRDAQNSFMVGTQAGCINCGSITLNFCDLEADPTFIYTAPLDPAALFGTITCAQTGTVTYFVQGNDLYYIQETQLGGLEGPALVVRNVTVNFSHSVSEGIRTRRMATMHIGAPAAEPVVEMTYQAYLRSVSGE
jgi:type II secretory pathway component PulJ